MNKPWYQSKTILFNALTIVLAVATYYGFTPDQSLFAQATAFLVSLAPVVNIGLRLVTKQPIAVPTN